MKTKQNDQEGAARRAAKLAKAAAKAAEQAATLRRREERRAAKLRHRLGEIEFAAGAGAADRSSSDEVVAALRPRRRALLIVNSKSGPNHDSLLRVRELVTHLAAHGVDAEVRVKLRKEQARKDARRAAKDGYPLVIAAGGDGTVEAVAGGLVGTGAALGIIPLGTYNNVAGSLGIPQDAAAACALVAAGAAHPIDAGLVRAHGRRKPRVFLEMAAVGLTAALMPAGQEAKKGDWDAAGQALPQALQLAPVPARITLDGATEARRATTLLVEVANAPRMGPALEVAPEARMDDGLLDVAIHHDAGPAALLMRLVALKAGSAPAGDEGVERVRARRICISTDSPLPVVADSKVVGTTPARFEVVPGGLLVVAGAGPGLGHPASPALVAAAEEEARVLQPPAEAEPDEAPLPPLPAEGAAAIAATVVPAVVPAVGKAATFAGKARTLALPAVAGAVAAAALPLLRSLAHRRRG